MTLPGPSPVSSGFAEATAWLQDAPDGEVLAEVRELLARAESVERGSRHSGHLKVDCGDHGPGGPLRGADKIIRFRRGDEEPYWISFAIWYHGQVPDARGVVRILRRAVTYLDRLPELPLLDGTLSPEELEVREVMDS